MLILQIALCMTSLLSALKLEPPSVPMKLTVVDRNNQPIAGASIRVTTDSGEGNNFKRNSVVVQTNIDGFVIVDRLQTLTEISVTVGKQDFATVYRSWKPDRLKRGNDIPNRFTLKLPRAISIGGRIVNAKGDGIAGATVEALLDSKMQGDPLGDGVHVSSIIGWKAGATQTNQAGYWFYDTVPDVPADYRLKISHPDYISDETSWGMALKQGITTEQLRSGKNSVVMKQGAKVTGTIRRPDSTLATQALIVFDDSPHGPPSTWSVGIDKQGQYELPTLPLGRQPITVIAQGFSPDKQFVDLKVGPRKVDFKLKPGKSLKLKFVDQDGNPVHTYLSIRSWRSGEALLPPGRSITGIPKQSDDKGVYEWSWAPEETIRFRAEANDHQMTDFSVVADGTLQTILIRRIPLIRGTVLDTTTGKPIEKFKVIRISEFGPGNPSVDRRGEYGNVIKYLNDGQFTIQLHRSDVDHSIMIEAPGYRTTLSPPHLVAENISEVTFPMVPAPPVTGRILNLDGKPAANVKIGLGTTVQDVTSRLEDDDLTVKTDAQGRFQFPAQSEPFMLFAETKQGFIEQRFEPDAKVGDLIVERGITVAGTLQHNGEPLRNNYVNVSPIHVEGENVKPNVEFRYSIATDAEGAFEFHIPSFDYAELRYGLPNETNGLRFGMASIPFSTMPGGVYRFDIGKKGAHLVGQLELAKSQLKNLDFKSSTLMLISRQPEMPYPPEWNRDTTDIAENGQATLTSNRLHRLHRTIELQPLANGKFRIPSIPAGTYWLTVRLNQADITTIVPVTISAEQANKQAKVKLPKIVVQSGK